MGHHPEQVAATRNKSAAYLQMKNHGIPYVIDISINSPISAILVIGGVHEGVIKPDLLTSPRLVRRRMGSLLRAMTNSKGK